MKVSTIGYADDTVIHCKSEAQAKFILDKVQSRMEACKLELHPVKTKIVCCQDRGKQYGCTSIFWHPSTRTQRNP